MFVSMPRPTQTRKIDFVPHVTRFKPCCVPRLDLQEVVLTLDELESLRLADLNGLYQEDAAQQMGVSRSVFARILTAARKKIADALIHGKSLRFEGGAVRPGPGRARLAGECPPGCPCGGGRGGRRRRGGGRAS